MDIVDETLKHWRQTTFEWSQRDCLLSVSDYLVTCGYPDYGVPFRGLYNDEDGAKRMITEAGGELAIMRRPNLSVIERPERGDIMLLQWSQEKVAAICTGKGAAMRLMRGACEIDLRFVEIIEAWKVSQCHL